MPSPVSLVHLLDDALPGPLFRRLRSRIRALGSERMQTTYQTTFWFDFGPPTSLVEEALLLIRKLVPAGQAEGVEWWLSRMKTNRVGVDFHQDRDERLALQARVLRHPLLSSVLFLNRVRGGALAVTGQAPNARKPCCAPFPLDADLVAPRSNRLAWFNGRLTHGVLDSANQVPDGTVRREGELRLAVVMNWWRRRPTEVPRFAEVGAYASLRVTSAAGRTRRRTTPGMDRDFER